MNAPQTESLRSRLETLIALARLLERVEASPRAIGADQYRALIGQVKAALDPALPEQALEAILAAHPATAEIYENLHYGISGLSRAPLDRSVATEMLASQPDCQDCRAWRTEAPDQARSYAARHSFGMRRVLLTMSVPESAKSSTSGCSSTPSRRHDATVDQRADPTLPDRDARGSRSAARWSESAFPRSRRPCRCPRTTIRR